MALKGLAALLPGIRVQVRLNQQPTGRLSRDLFCAIFGKASYGVLHPSIDDCHHSNLSSLHRLYEYRHQHSSVCLPSI